MNAALCQPWDVRSSFSRPFVSLAGVTIGEDGKLMLVGGEAVAALCRWCDDTPVVASRCVPVGFPTCRQFAQAATWRARHLPVRNSALDCAEVQGWSCLDVHSAVHLARGREADVLWLHFREVPAIIFADTAAKRWAPSGILCVVFRVRHDLLWCSVAEVETHLIKLCVSTCNLCRTPT